MEWNRRWRSPCTGWSQSNEKHEKTEVSNSAWPFRLFLHLCICLFTDSDNCGNGWVGVVVYMKCAANFAGSYWLPEWVSAFVQSLTSLQVTISRHVGNLNRIFWGTTRIVVRLNVTELLVCNTFGFLCGKVVWKQMNYCTFNLDLTMGHNKL